MTYIITPAPGGCFPGPIPGQSTTRILKGMRACRVNCKTELLVSFV